MPGRPIFFILLLIATIGCRRASDSEKPKTDSMDLAVASNPAEASTPESAPPEKPSPSDAATASAKTQTPAGNVDSAMLTEVTGEVGFEQDEVSWPDGFYLTPEITPGGVALFDFDGDGDLDIYQICHCPPLPMPQSFRQPAANRLFRQTESHTFEEVTDAAGLNDDGYGHGCAVGDVDNDGDLDVYVTNYGPDAFYVNDGNGSYSNQTAQAGFSGDKWSSAAAFFDYDRDGFLDLFVVHFATFDATRKCGGTDANVDVDYCGPHLFTGMKDQLYHNNGDGTFSDVSETAGITVAARGWGVIATDLTGDGFADIYVCNDEEPNQLWVNDGSGHFVDEAVFRGLAFNGMGRPEASMGVTLGDVDQDQTLDLFMTHVTSETNTLYTQQGDDLFNDSSTSFGTAAVDLPYTGWGCGFVDLDLDGDLDLVVANGRVAIGAVNPASRLGPFWDRYAEDNLVFLNDGNGRMVNHSSQMGTFTSRPEVTRGLAFGDLDSDGDVDLVTNDLANQLRVFRNEQAGKGPAAKHWLELRVISGMRFDIGATVSIEFDNQHLIRPVLRSYSYLASNDPRVHFGLGESTHVDSIAVTWADGSQEVFDGGPADREITITKGTGRAVQLGAD